MHKYFYYILAYLTTILFLQRRKWAFSKNLLLTSANFRLDIEYLHLNLSIGGTQL